MAYPRRPFTGSWRPMGIPCARSAGPCTLTKGTARHTCDRTCDRSARRGRKGARPWKSASPTPSRCSRGPWKGCGGVGGLDRLRLYLEDVGPRGNENDNKRFVVRHRLYGAKDKTVLPDGLEGESVLEYRREQIERPDSSNEPWKPLSFPTRAPGFRRPGKMRKRPRTKSISERSRRGHDVSKDEGPLPKP